MSLRIGGLFDTAHKAGDSHIDEHPAAIGGVVCTVENDIHRLQTAIGNIGCGLVCAVIGVRQVGDGNWIESDLLNHIVKVTLGFVKSADAKFVKKAAVGGMAEVKLGELASQKAKRDDVKKFGQQDGD